MFMDSGADASIISRDILPPNYTQCHPVYVTGVNSQDRPKLCQTQQQSVDSKHNSSQQWQTHRIYHTLASSEDPFLA